MPKKKGKGQRKDGVESFMNSQSASSAAQSKPQQPVKEQHKAQSQTSVQRQRKDEVESSMSSQSASSAAQSKPQQHVKEQHKAQSQPSVQHSIPFEGQQSSRDQQDGKQSQNVSQEPPSNSIPPKQQQPWGQPQRLQTQQNPSEQTVTHPLQQPRQFRQESPRGSENLIQQRGPENLIQQTGSNQSQIRQPQHLIQSTSVEYQSGQHALLYQSQNQQPYPGSSLQHIQQFSQQGIPYQQLPQQSPLYQQQYQLNQQGVQYHQQVPQIHQPGVSYKQPQLINQQAVPYQQQQQINQQNPLYQQQHQLNQQGVQYHHQVPQIPQQEVSYKQPQLINQQAVPYQQQQQQQINQQVLPRPQQNPVYQQQHQLNQQGVQYHQQVPQIHQQGVPYKQPQQINQPGVPYQQKQQINQQSPLNQQQLQLTQQAIQYHQQQVQQISQQGVSDKQSQQINPQGVPYQQHQQINQQELPCQQQDKLPDQGIFSQFQQGQPGQVWSQQPQQMNQPLQSNQQQRKLHQQEKPSQLQQQGTPLQQDIPYLQPQQTNLQRIPFQKPQQFNQQGVSYEQQQKLQGQPRRVRPQHLQQMRPSKSSVPNQREHQKPQTLVQGNVPQQKEGFKKMQGSSQQQQKDERSFQQQPKAETHTNITGTLCNQIEKVTVADGKELTPIKFERYAPGVKCRNIIKVDTNHFSLDLGKLKTAYHYDVTIIPDTPKKFLRNVMDLFREQTYPQRWPAFDGRKNLYSSSKLPFGDFVSGEVILRGQDGREKSYKVQVKFANEVDLRPLTNLQLSGDTPRDALQVVDIVLRSAPAVNLIPVGKSFFSKPATIIELGEGMEMYNGTYQSTIRGWKPFLNVDVAHKAFPKSMNLIDALVEVLSSYNRPFNRTDLQYPLENNDSRKFEDFIKTLRVIFVLPNTPSSKREYRVNGLKESADRARFTLDNGQTTTVANYFQNQKKQTLKYPALPTIWVGDQRRNPPVLIPMEFCTLKENQVLNRKMTENQTRNMIRYAATDTNTRKNKIKTGIESANYNTHPSVKEFGFSVSNVFERLDARVLNPPLLNYNSDRPVSVSKGVWRTDRFFAGAEINSWTIVSADRRAPRSEDFAKLEDMLYDSAQENGIKITNRAQRPFINIGATAPKIKQYFQSKKGQFDVIFVILPPSGPEYSYVKSAAEINTGCLTQCIKSKTLSKMTPQTAGNILLKVNAKLNGTNHCLQNRPPIMNRPTMIMGADVTHPSPEATHIPSVAAVTASHDPKAFKYNICWRLQPPKQEIIDDLENITVEHLKYFFEKNRVKPERIVFFRDGVSEGQFDIVRRAEITAIRAACKKQQSDGYEPAITFLVVQKRHHTRLFPVNPRDSEDRNFNVPAGTCVDHTITHPFMQDFYLVSHASIQGVAKPTKYCTLWDDNDLSNDDIEELTYFLCHMFSRCNRSVSYPAPTYYAHLAAARAKVYIENDRLDLNDLRREYQKYLIQDEIRKGKPMFFV